MQQHRGLLIGWWLDHNLYRLFELGLVLRPDRHQLRLSDQQRPVDVVKRAMLPSPMPYLVELNYRPVTSLKSLYPAARFCLEHASRKTGSGAHVWKNMVEYGLVRVLVRPTPQFALETDGDFIGTVHPKPGICVPEHTYRPKVILIERIMVDVLLAVIVLVNAEAVLDIVAIAKFGLA